METSILITVKKTAWLLAADYPSGWDRAVYAVLNCVDFIVETHLVGICNEDSDQ